MENFAKNFQHMKWNGWGHADKKFSMDNKPDLWEFLLRELKVNQLSVSDPVDLANINLNPPHYDEQTLNELKKVLHPEQIKMDDYERLLHTYGKSFRDLWRLRKGVIENPPDCVCYPHTEDDIKEILKIAFLHNVVLIPFGGGTNIAGCLENLERQNRMVIALDLRYLNKVLEIDPHSLFATIQAGVLGPDLELQLNERGFTLGHFPDSFEHSSLGGWVATRSAGMQSDKYGKIEDMVVSLRMITPQGEIITKTVPKASNGFDLNFICIGSEGTLGVITQVTVKVHPLPEQKKFIGYLFPNFQKGLAAIHECVRQNCIPIVTRLSDAEKTKLSFAYKDKTNGWQKFLAQMIKKYLKVFKHFDFSHVCLMIVAFEGDQKLVKKHGKQVDKIYKKYGAFNLGEKPGKAFEKGKYDFPYLRDLVMDYGLIADVSETSTTWSNIPNLYQQTRHAIIKAMLETNDIAWCGCHISHTYHNGASLYFTFGCQDKNGIEQYLHIKKAAEDSFVENGGCLSHHHAVGFEHLPWIQHDISPTGIHVIRSLKAGLDPKGIMNPGKIIPG